MSALPFDPLCTRGRVLLVESASVFREMQVLLLQRAGYGVVVCDHVDTALEETGKQAIDVAVLTSDAAGVDQPRFLAALRQNQPKMGVVFITTNVTMDLTRELMSRGVSSVLQRPVNPAVLMSSIDEAMGLTLQPGSPRFHSEALPGAAPFAKSVAAQSSASATPFSTGSAVPFSTPSSHPPFQAQSASPFVGSTYSAGHSASPFRPQSASPFGTYAGR